MSWSLWHYVAYFVPMCYAGLLGLGLGLEAKISGLGLETYGLGLGLEAFGIGLGLVFLALALFKAKVKVTNILPNTVYLGINSTLVYQRHRYRHSASPRLLTDLLWIN